MSLLFDIALFGLIGAGGFLWISRLNVVRAANLAPRLLLSLYTLTLGCGLALGRITALYFPGSDYWTLHAEGLMEWKLLSRNPRLFFTDIFYSPYENAYGHFFDITGSYWHDLRNNLISKSLALLNLLTRGQYYLNSMVLNLFGFLGHIAIFRIFQTLYPEPRHRNLLVMGAFLIPSTLYFASGIHKDLIVFTALSFFCHSWFFGLTRGFTRRNILIAALSFLLLLLFRHFLALALLPAAAGLALTLRQKKSIASGFGWSYGLFFLIGMLATAGPPSVNPVRIISDVNAEYRTLPVARSQVEAVELDGTTSRLFSELPLAMENGYIRPCLTNIYSVGTAVFTLEWLAIQCLLLTYLYSAFRRRVSITPWTAFGLLLGLSLFLLAGYIAPNFNTLVRYRCLYEPWLVIPLLLGVFGKKE